MAQGKQSSTIIPINNHARSISIFTSEIAPPVTTNVFGHELEHPPRIRADVEIFNNVYQEVETTLTLEEDDLYNLHQSLHTILTKYHPRKAKVVKHGG